jgi:hypothetical protein
MPPVERADAGEEEPIPDEFLERRSGFERRVEQPAAHFAGKERRSSKFGRRATDLIMRVGGRRGTAVEP